MIIDGSLRRMTLLLLASALCVSLMMARAHEALQTSGHGAAWFLLAISLCWALRYRYRLPASEAQRRVRDLMEYLGLFSLICVIGAIASYPDAASSSGMADPMLARADRLLHFDWVRLYRVVADHRLLQIVGSGVYQSIYVTPAALFGYFAWVNRRSEAYSFLLAFWIAALMTLLLFRWLPAAGPFAYLWHGPIHYMPQSALYQARLIPLLQSHAPYRIDVASLHGLVSAPSFHAASGVLYIWFALRVPRLGGPLVFLNLLMIAATPVEGTHYLVDVISGVFVALTALGIAWLLQRPRAMAWGRIYRPQEAGLLG